MRLLLISNSTNPGETYLDYPKKHIQTFLEKEGNIREVLFVPYAAVTFSHDAYVDKVGQRFDEFGVKVRGIHRESDPVAAVRAAQAIVVGGGNTFRLLKYVRESGIVNAVREKVGNGTPYVGWSAGSNMACPTICTTNDMPIVEPDSFEAFNLIPFQINPHYLDAHPQGHAGETREQRIEEYIAANPGRYVAGLREGCIFLFEDGKLSLIGDKPVRVFKNGQKPVEVNAGEDFGFLFTS
ncbi:MAG: dipeptidase PepE [Prevotellaceae bacterium]|jgi:dipeptidase E|nr:dipeptidase PepE [Prevotellaceae bacterium]